MSSDEAASKQASDTDQPEPHPEKQQQQQQQASPPAAAESGPAPKRQTQLQQYDRQPTPRDRARMEEIEMLEAELDQLGDSLPNARRLVELEIHRLRWGVTDMVDLLSNRRCKIRGKVLIPQDVYPGINFVGKLLGQGGASLRKLQEEANVKMSILGAGSMRNDRKEQECLESGESKYQHLKQTLHLQIDCLAEPAEAYYRISHALAKVKEAMTPDPNELAMYYSNHMQQQHPHQHPQPHYGAYGPGPHQHPHMSQLALPPPPPPPHHHAPQYAGGPPPPPLPGMGSRGGGRLSGRGGGGAPFGGVPIGAMVGGGYQMGGGGMRGGRGGRGGGMRAGLQQQLLSSNGGPPPSANGSGGYVNYDGAKGANGNGGYRGSAGRGQPPSGTRAGYAPA